VGRVIGVFRYEDSLGKRLVLILKSYPCSWGRCTFCPFALEQSTNIKDIIDTNRRLIREALNQVMEEGFERIAVFNGGSFHELPFDTAEKLTPLARGRVFEVEERSEFVTENSVKALLNLYHPSKLVIRMGFEVFDERLREEYLRKGMPDSELHRVVDLRRRLREEGLPVEFWTYVLFGIEGIPEDKVVESVREFKKLFDGVIAVKYHKYLPHHPKEVGVSEDLAKLLEEEADLVDWGGDQWVMKGSRRSA
jgi:uncharacterized Fe-S cluster-containing MiaB family protein